MTETKWRAPFGSLIVEEINERQGKGTIVVPDHLKGKGEREKPWRALVLHCGPWEPTFEPGCGVGDVVLVNPMAPPALLEGDVYAITYESVLAIEKAEAVAAN